MSLQQTQLYAMRGIIASLSPADQAAVKASAQVLAAAVQSQGRYGVLAIALISAEIGAGSVDGSPGSIDAVLTRLAQS